MVVPGGPRRRWLNTTPTMRTNGPRIRTVLEAHPRHDDRHSAARRRPRARAAAHDCSTDSSVSRTAETMPVTCVTRALFVWMMILMYTSPCERIFTTTGVFFVLLPVATALDTGVAISEVTSTVTNATTALPPPLVPLPEVPLPVARDATARDLVPGIVTPRTVETDRAVWVIPVVVPYVDTPVARKQRLDWQQQSSTATTTSDVRHPDKNRTATAWTPPHLQFQVQTYTHLEQRQLLQSWGHSCYSHINLHNNNNNIPPNQTARDDASNHVLQRFDELMGHSATTHLGIELWKYCTMHQRLALASSSSDGLDAPYVAFLDPASPWLVSFAEVMSTIMAGAASAENAAPGVVNFALLGDSYFPHTMHGSFLVWHTSQLPLAMQLVQVLVDTPVVTLRRQPLYLPRLLYALIHAEASSLPMSTNHRTNPDKREGTTAALDEDPLEAGWNGKQWYMFENSCRIDSLRRSSDGSSSSGSSSNNDDSNDDRTLLIVDPHHNRDGAKSGGRYHAANEESDLGEIGNSNGVGGTGRGASHWTDASSFRVTFHCQDINGYCCSAVWVEQHSVLFMNSHPVWPYPTMSDANDLPTPYNAVTGHFTDGELPFISTVSEIIHHRTELEIQNAPATPNFFDVLLANDCLPSSDACSKCLHNKAGADCHACLHVCSCYCKTLCQEPVDAKFVSKELLVVPPVYSRDPNRLIPRIIHQTWFEELSPDKYPNMSRLVESFKQSGWEYKFYSDEDAASFLSTHFPTEIREAYDALRPGAFKADLFRYCVLLIYGGVYADVDILLESALDFAVPPDLGFMVPIDEPGTPVKRRMCLWNGLIAAAPGHVFLATAIQTVVNQVRNRFTSVDVDATFCPHPEMSVLHAFDTLFTAGPCLLGASLNRVLGRHGQTQFEAGEIHTSSSSTSSASTIVDSNGRSFTQPPIPGRTIILHQNKWDMGSHRFTNLVQNLVVAATDMPDSNDREKVQDKKEHYSKTHAKTGIYGLANLYTDNRRANEDIRIHVVTATDEFQGSTNGRHGSSSATMAQ